MNIKEVSERLNISRETLRYWEGKGLIPTVPRDKSGYRDYTEKEVKWVLFTKAMRKAGMSIDSLVEFVNLYRSKADTREAQKALLQEQYDQLVQQRHQLDQTINYLKYKLDHFESHVLPFLEEEAYYEMRKEKLLDRDE